MEKDHVSAGSVSQDSNLLRYCTMGVGTAVLAGTVTTMDASVVYTNFNSTVLTDTTVGDSMPTDYQVYLSSNGTFNLTGNGLAVANFFVDTESSGATTNFAVVTAGVGSNGTGSTVNPLNVVGITVAGASSHTYNYPSRLAAGVSVGPAGKFVTLSGTRQSLAGGSLAFGAGFTNSKWAKAGKNSGYLGISFDGTDGALHFGFLQFTVATNTSTTPGPRSITLIGGGYQTTANTAITTAAQPGAVPEPTSLALLAAGGVGGLAAFRRRKQAAAAV